MTANLHQIFTFPSFKISTAPRKNSKGFLALEMENYNNLVFVSFCIVVFLLKQKIEIKYIFLNKVG
jgi:hypothetical protein